MIFLQTAVSPFERFSEAIIIAKALARGIKVSLAGMACLKA